MSSKINVAQVCCFIVDYQSKVLLMLHCIDDDESQKNCIKRSNYREQVSGYLVVGNQLLDANSLSDVQHSRHG